MSDIAIAEPGRGQIAPQKAKRERISPRIRRAIDALVTGEAKTQKDAAAIAQLNAEHLCRELKKPQIEVFYARRTREIIRGAQMRAAAKVCALIDANSEHVAADTSFQVLAINGIKPEAAQTAVNINISPGYVIDYHDPRDITPAVTVNNTTTVDDA